MENKNRSEILEKIKKGLDLVSKRLIEQARKENRELVVMKDDKIMRVRFTNKGAIYKSVK